MLDHSNKAGVISPSAGSSIEPKLTVTHVLGQPTITDDLDQQLLELDIGGPLCRRDLARLSPPKTCCNARKLALKVAKRVCSTPHQMCQRLILRHTQHMSFSQAVAFGLNTQNWHGSRVPLIVNTILLGKSTLLL